MRMGLDSQLPEHILAKYPEFPLVLVDDIPFLLAPAQGRFGSNNGQIEDPHEALDYYLQYADVRSGPLTPRVSPLQAANTLMKTDLWSALRSSKMSQVFGSENLLRVQVLLALGRVVPFSLDDKRSILGYAERAQMAESAWTEKVATFKNIDASWDGAWQDFVSRKQSKNAATTAPR
jgi:hypothetical protein